MLVTTNVVLPSSIIRKHFFVGGSLKVALENYIHLSFYSFDFWPLFVLFWIFRQYLLNMNFML